MSTAKEYVSTKLNEFVHDLDTESDDLPLEHAKLILIHYLDMCREDGVKEAIISQELPDDTGVAGLVQEVLDDLIPKLQRYVAHGSLPIKSK